MASQALSRIADDEPDQAPAALPVRPESSSPLGWLTALEGRGIVFGLEPTLEALAALGHPETAYDTLHIAGTNGKGSTSAFAAALLASQGHRVGLYTSPHLIRLAERIVVLEAGGGPGQPIAEVELAELAALLRERTEPGLTFFEAVTVLALEYFRRARVDVVVLETGLGGRLDATNVCAPLGTVITNVALEHQAMLGDTVAAIAVEKAGIIKRSTPVLTAARDPAALEVIAARAALLGAPLLRLGAELRLEPQAGGGLHYDGPGGPLAIRRLGLAGLHQRDNAALALGLVGAAGLRRSGPAADLACRRALEQVVWPGRLERLQGGGAGGLTAGQEMIAAGPELIVDSAHNPAAAWVLREALLAEHLPAARARGGRLHLCFGVLADKNVAPMLAALAPLFDEVWPLQPEGPRGRDPASYAALLPGARPPARTAEVLPRLLERCPPEDLIVVAGSCVLVGEALELFEARQRTSARASARAED